MAASIVPSGLQRRRGVGRGGSMRCNIRSVIVLVVASLNIFAMLWYMNMDSNANVNANMNMNMNQAAESAQTLDSIIPTKHLSDGRSMDTSVVNKIDKHPRQEPECSFRDYPSRRYYRMKQDTKELDFLSNAEYIYGLSPIVLRSNSDYNSAGINSSAFHGNIQHSGKMCVNQTEWDPHLTTLPFADGTNPSLVNIDRLLSHAHDNYDSTVNNNSNHAATVNATDIYKQLRSTGTTMLSTICMTSSQCSWKDTPQEKQLFQIAEQERPTTMRTLFLTLNEQTRILEQTTLYLEKDAPYGRKSKRPEFAEDGTSYKKEIKALDDARLFVTNGALWIHYREGKDFGYDKQIINKVHLERNSKEGITVDGTSTLHAYIKASETKVLCCGRNMAMVDTPTGLKSLTWVDPVTMVDIEDSTGTTNVNNANQNHRQLRVHERKSHFHGTSGFLVWLPSSSEYLGVGHFHRPHGRDTSNYAKHGHHYTHAFFTISAATVTTNKEGKLLQPFQLSRLSREFVFRTQSSQFFSKNKVSNHNSDGGGGHDDDVTDIIQFASGMELVGDDQMGKLLIAYGINDCEAGTIYLDMKGVQEMLSKVGDGQKVVEVVDTMKPLQNAQ